MLMRWLVTAFLSLVPAQENLFWLMRRILAISRISLCASQLVFSTSTIRYLPPSYALSEKSSETMKSPAQLLIFPPHPGASVM